MRWVKGVTLVDKKTLEEKYFFDDPPEKIAEKLNTLEGAIDASVIKDLPKLDPKDFKIGGKYQLELRDIKGARLDRASGGFDMNDQRWHGGGGGGTGNGVVKTIVAGPGISVNSTDPANPIVSATGGGGGITAWLTPPEAPNGVITAFTVVGTPTDVVADGVNFFLNNGYTIIAGQVVFDNPPTQYVRYRTASTWTTPPESPNGVILTFTVGASAPTDVIADGLEFFNGFGYTFAAGQITFDNPPTQYVRYR